MHKNEHSTIIDVISDLQARGFLLDFTFIGNKLFCAQEQCYLGPEEFYVLEMYCLQAGGPIRDETIVYGIGSVSGPWKGILLYSGKQTPALMRVSGFWLTSVLAMTPVHTEETTI
jgi:hypothetical protein